MITKERRAARDLRHRRVRRSVRGSSTRPRLAVFRSLNHIYAQLIDDDAGRTLLAVDSRSKAFRVQHRTGGNGWTSLTFGPSALTPRSTTWTFTPCGITTGLLPMRDIAPHHT